MSNKLITKEYLEKQLKNYKSQVLVKNFVSHEDGKELFSGSYNDLTDKPDIPTVTNDLTDELKASYDDTVLKSHEHTNNNVLNKFTESGEGKLMFDGDLILNGITPHIGENGNWYVGEEDTGISAKGEVGKDGKSIQSITTDGSNNIIVTFTDNTTKNIGQLNINVSADFLTNKGFGNLRYYNNKFQSYDTSSSSWADIQATEDNPLIMNLAPQSMQKMHLTYDINKDAYKIIFKEPKDTIINGQMLVCVEGIKFVRKLNSEPKNVDDGTLVLDYKRRDFSNYNHTSFLDTEHSANGGENWYYKAFPYSTNGYVSNSSANVANCTCKDYWLFGFKLDQKESDPGSMITYLKDCDNAYYESAYMDYNSGTFNYGDWEDAWFIKNLKPVMLKYDGTVGYELNPNDYTKKLDGTASDISNASYQGNAMIGVPKVYWKIVDNGDNTANIYFSNKKVDNNFVCWSHIDNNGKEIDYCYMPIYNGYSDGTRLRSLSGKTPMYLQSVTTEISLAKANNTSSSNVIWYTEVFSDRMLINLLLLLIGKSTNTQAVFGNGYCTGGSENSNPRIATGTMNTKGLFWGSNGSSMVGVKVFGMEHWWGNQWRRIAGWINDKGTQKIKLTYGKSDGSTTTGYNTTGSGYISVGYNFTGAIFDKTVRKDYIYKMGFTKYGLIPSAGGGSTTTYYTDGAWFDNRSVYYSYVGGECANDYFGFNGAFTCSLANDTSFYGWNFGAAISCKPKK